MKMGSDDIIAMRNIALKQGCALLATAILGGLAAATLVRLAPGFGIDEREFDPRLATASVEAIRAARSADRNIGHFYLGYLRGLSRGEFGVSYALKRPVRQLLVERGPVTLRLAGCGLLAGWVLGLAFAIPAALWRRIDLLPASLAGILLCLPAALTGLLVLFLGGSAWWAVALVVFPKIFTYARNLLEKVSSEPHVLLARVKGLGPIRILAWHVLPSVMPELLALAGISVSLAFSAAIPVEAVCDVPGLGQLAWQSALGRDLPVLVTITLLLALITRVSNATADLATTALRAEPS